MYLLCCFHFNLIPWPPIAVCNCSPNLRSTALYSQVYRHLQCCLILRCFSGDLNQRSFLTALVFYLRTIFCPIAYKSPFDYKLQIQVIFFAEFFPSFHSRQALSRRKRFFAPVRMALLHCNSKRSTSFPSAHALRSKNLNIEIPIRWIANLMPLTPLFL